MARRVVCLAAAACLAAAQETVPGFAMVGRGECRDGAGRTFDKYELGGPADMRPPQCAALCVQFGAQCRSITYHSVAGVVSCALHVDPGVEIRDLEVKREWLHHRGGGGVHPAHETDGWIGATCYSYTEGLLRPPPPRATPPPTVPIQDEFDHVMPPEFTIASHSITQAPGGTRDKSVNIAVALAVVVGVSVCSCLFFRRLFKREPDTAGDEYPKQRLSAHRPARTSLQRFADEPRPVPSPAMSGNPLGPALDSESAGGIEI
eukprot:TRINITY_DN14755_c0_g1_i1.p1 TRINITY_DN14755_c0_g1~~TRINITY_DN14755_c0_g1_i1.p1  ORF type:complete len:262 (+),score=52.22 TRINITY_DN14755_c0_g1_i1:67-852(+)